MRRTFIIHNEFIPQTDVVTRWLKAGRREWVKNDISFLDCLLDVDVG